MDHATHTRFRRPRLRPDHPLLWRAGDRLQVGIDDRAVQLGTVTPPLVRWLLAIDGTRDWDEVADAQRAHGISDLAAERHLHQLAAAGALEDAAEMPHALRWMERGARDVFAGDLAAAAFTYGDAQSANIVIDRRMRTRVGIEGSGLLAECMRDAVDVSGMVLADDDVDVQVFAECAHPALQRAPATQVTHLPIAVFGDRGVVGPLVVPGRTSCLRCTYLHLRDADPDWPIVGLQLESSLGRITLPIDRLLARLVTERAALLIRRWADDPLAVADWGDQRIELHLPNGEAVARPAPAHPLCGCRWPG